MDIKTPLSETGWRGSPEVWLDAACQALADGGVQAVRIQALAKTLKLSRTSFYWFFADREALLAALVQHWEALNTPGLVARADLWADSINEAILNVFDAFFAAKIFDSRLEFAIRSWAMQDDKLARHMAKADEMRVAAITRMFLRFGFSDLSADTRARALYLTQIGYISLKSRDTLAGRMKRIPDYVAIFSGMDVTRAEMARFFARHAFVPDPGFLERLP